MTPKAPNSRTSDPRIVSPEIKVVYPSARVEKDLSVSELQTTAPAPQVLPTAPAPVTAPTKESTTVTQETTTPTTNEAPKASTWKDTLKEHAQLFIAVALISVGIGILIGKKL